MNMREIMRMVEKEDMLPTFNRPQPASLQNVLDCMDRLLGNQMMLPYDRATAFKKIAETANRMAAGLLRDQT